MLQNYKISIIIPIHNTGKYIARCAESLLSQTLDEIEYIFINDGTPDNSIEILSNVIANYPHRKDDIKIINHNPNKGTSASRNAGLSIAAGEYIFHCDSDDWVECSFCEKAYNKAKETDSDIVWSDYYISSARKNKYIKQKFEENKVSCLLSMFKGNMQWNVWNKIFKKELYSNEGTTLSTSNNLTEDWATLKLFYYANKVSYLSGAYYHYSHNPTSTVHQKLSQKLIENTIIDLKAIFCFFEKQSDYFLYEKQINYFKLICKIGLMWRNTDKMQLKQYSTIFPETNEFIFKSRDFFNIHIKIILWLSSKGRTNIVWVHNVLLNQIKKINNGL